MDKENRRCVRRTVSSALALVLCFAVQVSSAETRPAARSAARSAVPTRSRTGQRFADAFAEPPINAAAVLSKSYEEKARDVLERYIPAREFEVNANVVPNGKPIPRAPYEPRAFTPGSSLNMEPEELEVYVSRISLEVLLSARLTSSRKRIEDLLFKTLKLKRGRDRVTFDNLGIDVESDEWRKEKTDLKREIEILKSENNRLNDELANRMNDASAAKNQPEKPAESMIPRLWKTDWFLPSLLGGAMFILLLGLIILARGFYTAGRNMGTAITNVASSLERIGGSISGATGGAGGTGTGIQSLEAKLLQEKQKGGLSSLPMESIMAHMMKLRHEILESLNDGTESIILRHLTQLLSNPATVGRAVCTLELLGRDTATELFRRLGVKAQETIMVFLRSGVYDQSKIEMMLEAGEELKTKLLVESFERVNGKPSEKVASRMIQLSDDELLQVALELGTEHLPRLFLYLDAPKIANLIAQMKRVNPDKFSSALSVLPKLPQAITNDSSDDNIIVAMDGIIDKTKADSQRPFLKVYQDIVESSEEELSEQIVRELSSDPRLDEFFRNNVITVHTFFLLPGELRNEIVESLSNKDIAALAAGVKPDEQAIVLASVSARRKEMVAEELESLTSRGGRQAQVAFKRVRELIVKRLREMKNEGTLVTRAQNETKSGAGAGREKRPGRAPAATRQPKEVAAKNLAPKEPTPKEPVPREPAPPKMGQGPDKLSSNQGKAETPGQGKPDAHGFQPPQLKPKGSGKKAA